MTIQDRRSILDQLKNDMRVMKGLSSKMPIQISTLEWLVKTIEDIGTTREVWAQVPKITTARLGRPST